MSAAEEPAAGRVTGIGGVFFTCEDPAALRDWYRERLGLEADDGGGIWFQWLEDTTDRTGLTVLGPFPDTTDYFEPSADPYMINYRVDDLDALVARLAAAGVEAVGEEFESEDGRFAWIVDPEGRKVELWEPAPRPPAKTLAASDVTGIGGVFFKARDPAAVKQWYADRLGIVAGDDGYVGFRFRDSAGVPAYLAWEAFPSDTDYFEPSSRPLMVNLRVTDLAALRERLAAAGDVWIDTRTESYDYGRFGWILDPAGTRIELWEPHDDFLPDDTS